VAPVSESPHACTPRDVDSFSFYSVYLPFTLRHGGMHTVFAQLLLGYGSRLKIPFYHSASPFYATHRSLLLFTNQPLFKVALSKFFLTLFHSFTILSLLYFFGKYSFWTLFLCRLYIPGCGW
jgi:hypothetical protein